MAVVTTGTPTTTAPPDFSFHTGAIGHRTDKKPVILKRFMQILQATDNLNVGRLKAIFVSIGLMSENMKFYPRISFENELENIFK
jgi:hypothetical protein